MAGPDRLQPDTGTPPPSGEVPVQRGAPEAQVIGRTGLGGAGLEAPGTEAPIVVEPVGTEADALELLHPLAEEVVAGSGKRRFIPEG